MIFFAGLGMRGAVISTIIGSLCTMGITLWIMQRKQFFQCDIDIIGVKKRQPKIRFSVL